jgi:tRNA-splicing ligase RtcB
MSQKAEQITLRKVTDYLFEIPKHGKMRVPARIFADERAIRDLTSQSSQDWNALQQLEHVAMLPGIQKAAMAMADVHPGYGFPIGGVAAFDPKEGGVISVAGVGFDINCGVRCLRTILTRKDLAGKEEQLADTMYKVIPAGLGSTGELKLSVKEIDRVLREGAHYAVRLGYGREEDLEYIEETGRLADADPTVVSNTAKQRQLAQVGTLGSGNHYVEVQVVDQIYNAQAAEAFGLELGQIVIMLHTGSRALGHQIGTDYLPFLERATRKYGIEVPDRELVCAPIDSPEGQQYFHAVMAGANCAFANRQVLTHLVRQAFWEALRVPDTAIQTLYEVAHNTVKWEIHEVDGVQKRLLVHRKGSTRAFGPGRPEIPARYRHVGQPVLVGGTMGTASYILVGTPLGMQETFGTALHGAGRSKSRRAAKKAYPADEIIRRLREHGILVRAHGKASISEEAPGAYKDVDHVVDVMCNAGIVARVARLRPIICLKG